MSTHNIGFYEDLTKIIFELSSNIIKYAPYFSAEHIGSLLYSRTGLHRGVHFFSNIFSKNCFSVLVRSTSNTLTVGSC